MKIILNLGYQDKKAFQQLLIDGVNFDGILITNGIHKSIDQLKNRIKTIKAMKPSLKILFDPLTYTSSFFNYSKVNENKIVLNDQKCKTNFLVFKDKLVLKLETNEDKLSLARCIDRSIKFQKEIGTTKYILPSIALTHFTYLGLFEIFRKIENKHFLKNSLLTIAIMGNFSDKVYEYLQYVANSNIKGIYLVFMHNEDTYSFGQDKIFEEKMIKIKEIFKYKEIILGFGESSSLIGTAIGMNSVVIGRSFTMRKFFRSSRLKNDVGKHFSTKFIKHKIFSPELMTVVKIDDIWEFPHFKEKFFLDIVNQKIVPSNTNYSRTFNIHIKRLIATIKKIKNKENYNVMIKNAIKEYEKLDPIIQTKVINKINI